MKVKQDNMRNMDCYGVVCGTVWGKSEGQRGQCEKYEPLSGHVYNCMAGVKVKQDNVSNMRCYKVMYTTV